MTNNEQRRIVPDITYSVGEVAKLLGSGRRPVYKAVRDGELRAAQINDRGDLRILGQWVLDFVDEKAANGI